jgi:hypothetical protein
MIKNRDATRLFALKGLIFVTGHAETLVLSRLLQQPPNMMRTNRF